MKRVRTLLTIAIALTLAVLFPCRSIAENLLVSLSDFSTVIKYTPSGTFTTNYQGTNDFLYPQGMAFDKAGNLFVSSGGDNSIYKFTTNGTRSLFASGLHSPAGLAFDQMGNLFEADEIGSNIYKFTATGTRTTFASGLGFIFGLAFDRTGNLFGVSWASSNIYEFAPGGKQTLFASLPDNCRETVGIAFDTTGNLFVTSTPNGGSGTIFEITTNKTITVLASQLQSELRSIAFDRGGNLFASEYYGRSLLEFKKCLDGTLSTGPVLFGVPGSAGGFLAFQPGDPPPTLNIVAAGNQAILYFPTTAAGYIVQTTTNMSSTNWTTLTNGTIVTALVVTNPPPAAYFRLLGPTIPP